MFSSAVGVICEQAKMDKEGILDLKLKSLFPNEEVRGEVQEILESYGFERHEQEPVRVRLAIIKLSGPDVNEIRKMTKYAKEDFRDILMWAEYPRQSKKWSMPDGPKKKKLVEADRKEYEQWLSI